MAEKSKIPAIRFAGFTEAWEQCKLGDETIEMLAGGDIDKDKVVENGEYPIYANALVNDGIVGYYDDYYRVKAPAVSVTGRGDVGHAQARMTDFTPVVRLLAIRSDHDCYFLENAINTQRIIVESTGVPQLTVPQLSSYDIFFPRKLEEEQKIGVYFHSIDNLITLHQRKYDKLVNVKKAMLEKMFPKDGADVPEIRFKGFTEAWEQRKLGDLASFSKGYGYSKSDLMESGTPIILYGRLYTNYETVISDVDTYVNEKKGSVYSRGGEIIVPASGETAEDISVASVVEKQGVLLGGDLNIVNPTKILNPVFLAISISNGNPHKEMTKMAQGKSVVHLHNADIEKINLNFPSCDEQVLISTYFQNIDNLITLHQRKCIFHLFGGIYAEYYK